MNRKNLVMCILLYILFQSGDSSCVDHNRNCQKCISDTINSCGYCGYTGECLTGDASGPTLASTESKYGGCDRLWQISFSSHIIKVERGFPVNPISADVFLVSNDPVMLVVDIVRPHGDDVPVDLVILQDASSSMGNDIDLFGNVIPRIMAGMYAEYKSSFFASNSFIDKGVRPFGNPSDYVFQFNTDGLSGNPSSMQIAIKKVLYLIFFDD